MDTVFVPETDIPSTRWSTLSRPWTSPTAYHDLCRGNGQAEVADEDDHGKQKPNPYLTTP